VEYITDGIYDLLEKQRRMIQEDLDRGGHGEAPDLAELFEREYPDACAPVSVPPSLARPRVFCILFGPAHSRWASCLLRASLYGSGSVNPKWLMHDNHLSTPSG
jgi:hypothetical protein